MPNKRSDLKKSGYAAKSGKGHGKGHPLQPAVKQASITAIKQRLGLPTGTGRPGFPRLPVE